MTAGVTHRYIYWLLCISLYIYIYVWISPKEPVISFVSWNHQHLPIVKPFAHGAKTTPDPSALHYPNLEVFLLYKTCPVQGRRKSIQNAKAKETSNFIPATHHRTFPQFIIFRNMAHLHAQSQHTGPGWLDLSCQKTLAHSWSQIQRYWCDETPPAAVNC